MKKNRIIALLFLFGVSFLWSIKSDIIDIRFGSYSKKNLISAKSKLADKTRLIIELSDSTNYDLVENNSNLQVLLKNTVSFLTFNNYTISDGLTEELSILPIGDDIQLNIHFEGDYLSNSMTWLQKPTRLVIDVIGEPKKIKEGINNPIAKKKFICSKPKSIIKNIKSNKEFHYKSVKRNNNIELAEVSSFFNDDSPLYLDLFDIPLKQVIRFFAKQSDLNIVADASVDGNITINIKNKSLAEVFKMLLETEGLHYSRNNGTVVISKNQDNLVESDYIEYPIFLKKINCYDMQTILLNMLPGDPYVFTDSRVNKITVHLPKHYVAAVDSLVKAFDIEPPSFKVTSSLVYCDKKDISNFSSANDGYIILTDSLLNRIKNKCKEEIVVRKSIAHIFEKKNIDNFIEKTYKTSGSIFGSDRISFTGGYNIEYTIKTSSNKYISLKAILSSKYVTKELASFKTNSEISVDLDKREYLGLVDYNLFMHDVHYDNWALFKPDFKNSNEYIPLIIISVSRLDDK